MRKVVIALSLVLFLGLATATVMHNADNLFLRVDGNQESLTYVLNNFLSITGKIIAGVDEDNLIFGHSSDNIIVDFHGEDKTLTEVLKNLSAECTSTPTEPCGGRCQVKDTCNNDLC